MIKTLVDYYQRFTCDNAQDRIADIAGLQINEDCDEMAKQKKRLLSRIKRVDKTTRNLLDNITDTNRKLVDQRLKELTKDREQIEATIESLEYQAISEIELTELVSETVEFINSLELSLCKGPLDERQATIRRCVDEILIDRDELEAKISLHVLPTIAVGFKKSAMTEQITVDLPEVKLGRPAKI